MDNGEVAVDADDNEQEGRQVEAEHPPEHEEATGEVSGRPPHGGMPRHLDGDHDERDDQVSDGQVHHVEVDTRPATAAAIQDDKDDEVAGSRDEEHNRVSDDGEDTVAAESQCARKSEQLFKSAVQLFGGDVRRQVERTRVVHRQFTVHGQCPC